MPACPHGLHFKYGFQNLTKRRIKKAPEGALKTLLQYTSFYIDSVPTS